VALASRPDYTILKRVVADGPDGPPVGVDAVLRRTLSLVFTLLVAALLVTLAVANRHTVDMKLDPFNPEMPALALRLPFFAFLFAMLITGVVLGGIVSWFAQGKWRRTARTRTQEALRWKAEVDRLMRERDAGVSSRRQIASR
jgi:uncharacterized integral membrane protein